LNLIARSIPDNSGMTTSESSKSGALEGVLFKASRGLVKEVAAKPLSRRIIASVSEITFSSSTTRIWKTPSFGTLNLFRSFYLSLDDRGLRVFGWDAPASSKYTSLDWGCFVGAEYLVGLNFSLLIKKPGRKKDGYAPFEMHHNACGQPFGEDNRRAAGLIHT
jgi:hypothetical protein